MKVEPVRPHAFLDISIGKADVGRIVVELFEDLAPLATKNFSDFCSGFPTYESNTFHRVLKNFVIQAGDLMYGGFDEDRYPAPKCGLGNLSVFEDGELFEDENLAALDGPFLLCLANHGEPNANGSQFFITTYPLPHLTGKHSVFGKVVHGKSVVRAIERVKTDKNNTPLLEDVVIITKCGAWDDSMPVPVFNASYDTRGGDIYEEYPDDDEHIDKESSESVYIASTKIKESGTLLFKAGEKQQALFKWTKCLRYVMEYIPDEDQEPQWYHKYAELKKKLYLNLSLVYLQLKKYQRGADYAEYLLNLDGLGEPDKAKGHFRKGQALLELKKYKLALKELKAAQNIVADDTGIEREITRCEALIEQQKEAEKAKYSKFFK